MKLSGGEERRGKEKRVQRSCVGWVWQYQKRARRPSWPDQRERGQYSPGNDARGRRGRSRRASGPF